MKTLLTARKKLIACSVFGLTAVAAAAQSLGPVRGTPLLGRPLELAVPVQFDAAEGERDCTQVQLFYGDARVDAAVRSVTRRGPRDATIAVSSKVPVNEPVVTLEVRAGCQNTAARRYTLLPEPVTGDEPLVASAPMTPATLQTSAAGAGAATIATLPQRAMQRVRDVIAAVKKPQRATPAAPRDRLQMDFVPLRDAPAPLRVSNRLSSPTEDGARRAAAAALWRAISAEPEQLQRNLQLLQAMHAEIGLMRATLARSNAELAGMRELAEQQKGVDPALLVAGAATLLLLTGAAAFTAYRTRRESEAVPKWFDETDPHPMPAVAVAEPDTGPDTQPQAIVEEAKPVAKPMRRMEATTHAGRVEALVSLLQEIEFLESLGLWGDAVDALEDYLKDAKHPPPAAYCELMRLCWANGDEVGLASARAHWLHVFGSQAPAKSEVHASAGIEAHGELIARITAAWPSQQVLDIIDRLLFAKPQAGMRMSLQAWRDLLWLHQMALAVPDGRPMDEALAARQSAELPPWLDTGGTAPAADVPARDAVDLDLNYHAEDSSVVLQEEAIAWAMSHHVEPAPEPVLPEPKKANVVPLPQPIHPKALEKKKDFATYEDLWDAVAAAEGKHAYRAG